MFYTSRMASRFVHFANFRIVAMRSSISKAIKFAARTSKNLEKIRTLSCTSIKQWNDRYDGSPSIWGGGQYWGVQRFSRRGKKDLQHS